MSDKNISENSHNKEANNNRKPTENDALFIHFMQKLYAEINNTPLNSIIIDGSHNNSNSEDNVDVDKNSCNETHCVEPVKVSVIVETIKTNSPNLNKNPDCKNKSIANSSGKFDFIDKLTKEIIEECNTLENLTHMKYLDHQLGRLLSYCSDSEVTSYLVEQKVLHKILNVRYGKELLAITILYIFTVYSKNETLELISNDKDFIMRLLKCIEFSNELALSQLFKFLPIKVLRIIQQNPHSNWIFLLRQFENLENFTILLFKMVDKHESIHYELIDTTIKMLRSMSETYVSFGMNLLIYLFNINKLIPAVLTFCRRLVTTQRNYFENKIDITDFISHWLLLMINIIKHKQFKFKEFDTMVFQIIYEILKPYEQLDILSLILTIEQRDINVIRRCMSLLTFFHSKAFCLRIDQILINMAFRIKRGFFNLDLDSKERHKYREKLLYKLSLELQMYWLCIMERYSNLIISRIINECEPEVKQFLKDLVASNGSCMIQEKFEKQK